MDKTINQYINQLHLDPKREAAVRKLIQSVSQSNGGNSGGSNTPEPEFVDLGLPSGTLWCSCNLGANSPEEPGNLYMWGDPTPYTIGVDDENNNPYLVAPDGSKILDEKDLIPRYKHLYYPSDDSEYYDFILNKYNADAELGTVDYLTELQPIDDTAYLYNKEHRIPSIVEINELIEYTSVQKIYEDSFGNMRLKLTSKINNNYIYVHSVSYCSDGIIWSNSLITPSYGGKSYDVAAKMYTNNGNIINIGANVFYGTFYRYRPTFIRPVKYGNIDSKSIINVDLQYLDENGFTDYIVYAKLVNGYITRKPIFDIHSRSFIKVTNFADNIITAQLETTGESLNNGENLNIVCREFTAESNGAIKFIIRDV